MNNLKTIVIPPLSALLIFALAGFAPNASSPPKGNQTKAGMANPHAKIDPEKQFQAALKDLRGGDKEAAQKKLDLGLSAHPEDVKMLSLRANLKLMSRKFFEALTDLNKAIRLKPDEAGLLVNRSLVYRSFKNYDQAKSDLDKAVKLKPNLYSALFNRGTLHYGQARMKEAVADFKKCISLSPKDPRPRHNLALALNEVGQQKEAITVLEALRKDIGDRHWRGVAAKQIRDWQNPAQVKADAKKTVPNPHAKPKDNKVK